jgi:Na+/H+ antiporter
MELIIEFPWMALLPPIIAIILCFATREVLPSLFIGVFVGALILKDLNPIAAITGTALIVRDNLADSWNATVILFDFIVGGLVGLIYFSGGAHGFANLLTSKIRSRRGGEMATSLLGMLIFFDDYSSSVITGNGMRPATEKLGVSREKLSYIVDSTSAPIATIGVISVWTGYQLGVIQGALPAGMTAWNVFFPDVILYSFYSFFAIAVIWMLSATKREFGPMLNAQYRTMTTGKLMDDDAKPLMKTEKLEVKEGVNARAKNMLLPVITLVVITILSLYLTGLKESGLETISFMDSLSYAGDFVMDCLLFGGLGAVIVAIFMYLVQGIGKLSELMRAFVNGAEIMVTANLILLLAWSIGTICGSVEKGGVGTGDFVVSVVLPYMPAWLLPAMIFLVSFFIGFSTGTSWGTMAIVLPMAIPLGFALGVPLPVAIAPVLSGGVCGDHCSPISDTTVMASMFSGSDHIAHVKTQTPYALLSASIAVLAYILISLNFDSKLLWGIALILGLILCYILIRALSKFDGKRKGIEIPLKK